MALAGWITLVNLQTGRRWAVRADDQPEQPGLYELLTAVSVSPTANLLLPNDEQALSGL